MTTRRIAVLGGGVTGSFFSRTLLDACKKNNRGAITLDVFEGGRGSGGRCSCRKSTRDALGPAGINMAITHGTPAFDAKSEQFRSIAEDLVQQGLLERWDECAMGVIQLAETNSVQHIPPNTHTLYRGRPETNNMEGICDILLDGATLHPKTLVSRIQPSSPATASPSSATATTSPPWELFGREGDSLGLYDWVVVTGTTAASDRWRAAYQSEPPLQELLPMFDSLTESGGGAPSAGAAGAAAAAVAAAADAADAIRALQAVQSRPVLTMMTVLTGEAMERWAAEFPFDLVHVEGSAIIKKVVRQTGNSKCLPIIVHSTPEYAEAHAAGIHGKHSSMAAIVGDPAAAAAAKTEAILTAMQEELAACVAPWVNDNAPHQHIVAATDQSDVGTAGGGGGGDPLGFNDAAYGPLLHRWGAAFPEQQPKGSLFRQEFPRVVPGAGLVFCGDYGGELVGRVETAAMSAIAAAEQVATHL